MKLKSLHSSKKARTGTTRLYCKDSSPTLSVEPKQVDDLNASTGEASEPKSISHKPSVKMSDFLSLALEVEAALFGCHAGPIKSAMLCTVCNASTPRGVYRCKECWGGHVCCKRCMVDAHKGNPLHIIEEWVSERECWTRTTLADLGMIIHLGDHGGSADAAKTVKFPGQIIPSFWTRSFGLQPGKSFRRLLTQGNVTAQDFLTCLVRQTDGVLPHTVKDCYREFLSATREYQFIKLCMRKGVQPSPELGYGSLATLCSACPHIDINISPEWTTRPDHKLHLDALYHAVDGNFTQNLKDKGSDDRDFPLTLGAGYFANENNAKTYFALMPPPKSQASSCNKFGAMGYYGHWGSVSGLVGLSCGGVDLKLGETWAAVNFLMLSGLQRWMQLRLHISAYDINCQYRIHFWERLAAIQEKFFKKRMSALASIKDFRFPATRAAVGKFHEPAHKQDCLLSYSFHYLPGAGQTDGEAPECIWASTTSLALRTREMSAGHRHDTINFFHNDMNWRRTYGIVRCLVKKYSEASKYESESALGLEELSVEINSSGLPANILDEWEAKKVEWEQHLIRVGLPPSDTRRTSRKPKDLYSPYEPAKTKAATQKEILESLQKRAAVGVPDGVGMYDIIHEGIELQELRSILALQLTRKSSSLPDEKVKEIQEGILNRVVVWEEKARLSLGISVATAMDSLSDIRRSSVRRIVNDREGLAVNETWDDEGDSNDEDDLVLPSRDSGSRKRKVQVVDAGQTVKQQGTKLGRKVLDDLQTIRIHLPSSYPEDIRAHPAMKEAVELEIAMRRADADDALDQVRAYLASTYGLHRHLKKSTTQQTKLRSRAPAQRLQSAVYAAANVYRRARVAMISLGMAESDNVYRPLKNAHLKAFVVHEQNRRLGDSRKLAQSWIWGSLSFVDNDFSEAVKDHMIENLRVHWCRTRATAERWAEEKEVVTMEMQRAVWFFEFNADLWQRQAETRQGDNIGSAAYARRQAFNYQQLLQYCRDEFAKLAPTAITAKCPYIGHSNNMDLD
ncbi:hypothetical protein BC835DRAFT_1307278 [Cytidiella melzeri]|nr:hypothetical protein BC835DRAFT_1307278 [Cytidiella melzeri]